MTLERVVGGARGSLPREFCTSLLFLGVNAIHSRDGVPQLIQPWDELFGLLLYIFVLLYIRQSWVEAAWSELTS